MISKQNCKARLSIKRAMHTWTKNNNRMSK